MVVIEEVKNGKYRYQLIEIASVFESIKTAWLMWRYPRKFKLIVLLKDAAPNRIESEDHNQ